MKTKVCTSCGYVGKPISQCAGSFLIDAMLWMAGISFAGMTGLVPVLLLPLAWSVYHIALFRSTKCPKCESLDMVRMSRAKGKAALERFAAQDDHHTASV